ncbi:MAG: hypothetical protein QOF59_599, partial [Actinomycetota bacterium]|nr:hypothetical protein [Actinomycetota bacterium]
ELLRIPGVRTFASAAVPQIITGLTTVTAERKRRWRVRGPRSAHVVPAIVRRDPRPVRICADAVLTATIRGGRGN